MNVKQTIVFLNNKNDDGCFNEAIAALIKAVPAPVHIREWSETTCPMCGSTFSKHHGDGYYSIPNKHRWCPDCGQTLEW